MHSDGCLFWLSKNYGFNKMLFKEYIVVHYSKSINEQKAVIQLEELVYAFNVNKTETTISRISQAIFCSCL